MLTVIIAAEGDARNLLALDAVKDELGVVVADDDARLGRYIRSATARLEQFCQRDTFAMERVRETLRHSCQQPWALLTRRPVAEVASVELDGVPLDDDGWEVDGRFLYRLVDGKRVSWPAGALAIVYDGGYALPDAAPGDLAEACMTLVKASWHARKRDPMLKSQSVDGVGTDTYWIGGTNSASGLPEALEAGLVNYRLV